jgi:(p)ppGpp synthase/HD superfamily hydrolase
MPSHDLLHRAIGLALHKHADQVDKLGQPYIFHLCRVMLSPRLTNDFERAAGVLHDVVEDGHISLNGLRSAGYDDDFILVIGGLTRLKNEDYDWYIANKVMARKMREQDIPQHIRLARIRVKLADLDDHFLGIHEITHEDRARLMPRYIRARHVLELELEGYGISP